jgi:CspA family cold shock protein
MPTGKVSFYDDCRGYGFIISDDGPPDVFVHAKFMVNASVLKKDQRVSYEVVSDASRGKPRADRVRIIDGAARTADGFDAIAYDNEFLLSPIHD